jgi:hypothetical protein
VCPSYIWDARFLKVNIATWEMYNIEQELKGLLIKQTERNTENEDSHCIWKTDHNIHTGHMNLVPTYVPVNT